MHCEDVEPLRVDSTTGRWTSSNRAWARCPRPRLCHRRARLAAQGRLEALAETCVGFLGRWLIGRAPGVAFGELQLKTARTLAGGGSAPRPGALRIHLPRVLIVRECPLEGVEQLRLQRRREHRGGQLDAVVEVARHE